MIRRKDEDHLSLATVQGRALYSFNIRDFHEIHTAWTAGGRSHCSIVLTQQQRYSTGEQIRRLLRLTRVVDGRNHEEPRRVSGPVVTALEQAVAGSERTAKDGWRRSVRMAYEGSERRHFQVSAFSRKQCFAEIPKVFTPDLRTKAHFACLAFRAVLGEPRADGREACMIVRPAGATRMSQMLHLLVAPFRL